MTVTAWLLLVPTMVVLVVIVCLLIPPADPDAHPFETDPWETEGERPGRHRMPEMEDGPIRRLEGGPLRYPHG